MKKINFIPSSSLAILLLLMAELSIAQPTISDCDTKERGGCPFKLGPLTVLDKCAGPFSSERISLCNAFNNADALYDNLRRGVTKFKEDAEKELKAHLSPIFKDAIDEQALADFNHAARFYKEIRDELADLIKDENCGPNQVRNLQRFFNQQINNIKAGTQIAGTGFGVLKTNVPTAMQHLGEFALALADAIKLASLKGEKGMDELKKIQDQLEKVNKQVDILKTVDVARVIGSGSDLVVNVGGLYGSCSACAASMSATISEVNKTLVETVATISTCPLTWEALGGSCWVSALAGLDVAGTALASLMVTGSCAVMTEQVKNIDHDIRTITTFTRTIQRTADAINSSINRLDESSKSIESLIKSSSTELKPFLVKMSISLRAAGGNFDNMFKEINTKVIPETAKFGGLITRQVVQNIEDLTNCYNQYEDMASRLSNETISGVKDMFDSGSEIIDAAKIMDNMGQGAINAFTAARNKAASEFNNVKESYSRIEKNLCINRNNKGELDIELTANCIKDNLAKDGPEAYWNKAKSVLNNTEDLLKSIGDLVIKAAEEGDMAYTGRPSNASKLRAKAKSQAAREKAHSASEKLKKATKREHLKSEAKEAARKKMKENLETARKISDAN